MSEQRLAQVTVKLEEDAEEWQHLDEHRLYRNANTKEEEYMFPLGAGRRHQEEVDRMTLHTMSMSPTHTLHSARFRMEARRADGRRRSVNWSVKELEGLLNALGRSPHLCLLMSSEHLSCINEWETVAEDMGQDGFSRTADQCRLKMKSLRRVFHHVRLGWVSGGRQTPILPPWFPRMKELWSQAGKPRFKTPFIEAPRRQRYRHDAEEEEDNEAEAMDVKGDREESRKREAQHPCPPQEGSSRGDVGPSKAQQPPQVLVPGNITSLRMENGVKIVTVACGASNQQPRPKEEEKVQNTAASALNSQGARQEQVCPAVPTHSASLYSYLTAPSRAVPPPPSGSTRSQPELPQSSDEAKASPKPGASGSHVTLLEELNTRVRRLEDSQQRTNELLQQLISVQTSYHQSSSHLLQEVVQRLDYSNQNMAMVGLLGHLGLVAKNQAVPGIQVPTMPSFFTPGVSTVPPIYSPVPTTHRNSHPSPSPSHLPLSDPQPMSSLPTQTGPSLTASDPSQTQSQTCL